MCWYVVFPSLFRSLVLDGNMQRDEIYNEINKLKRKKIYFSTLTTPPPKKKASGLSRPIRNNDDDSQQ